MAVVCSVHLAMGGCPTNRVVEAGTSWGFDAPTPFDPCTATNMTIVDLGAVTNALCGNTFSATQTWQVTDGCSNTSTCSQTITVVDTTPPVLACGTNRTVECGSLWDFDVPSASDISDGTNVVVTVLTNFVTPLWGNTFAATRIWQATDSCTNSSTCSQTITVVDTTPPVLACGTNRTVECGTVWDFDMPSASDICDGTNVTVVVLTNFVTPLCGNTFAATRIWQASDSSTNLSTCSQTITIVDTTPPVLACGTNRIVECSTVWEFDTPTAYDVCAGTNVVIEIVSTVTNHLIGETFSATRIWQATDPCTNSITCTQTVTIIDTTAPTIFCPTNVVVECDGALGKQVFFTPTAFDTCDTNVTIVSFPPSGAYFPLGTNTVVCTAFDDSGNTNQCSFTITVYDATPPVITCSSNLIIAEAPRDSGGAIVNFTVTASDICDTVPTVVSTPPPGTNFSVGYTTVNSVATDGSGNTNGCSFTVRVIPYRLYVLNTSDSGPDSLRQAILDANDSPDANLILFNIPGSGVKTIQPLSPLPAITSPVTIDGWSQPGFTDEPLVQLAGNLAGTNATGLDLVGGTNVVRGLVVNRFTTGIRIAAMGGNVIYANYIGTGPSGTTALPNTGDGVQIVDTGDNLIGSYTTGGNIIAFNGGNGVALTPLAGNDNAIVGNSIYSNGALGIDLGMDGPTLNDNDDFDAGPNRLQNFPVLSQVTFSSGITVIAGTLNSVPNRTYRIQFFLNDFTNSSGFGEGKTLIGSLDQFVHGDGNGDFAVSFVVPANYTQFVTATATDPNGSTSEFSPPMQVTTPPMLVAQPTNTIIFVGSNMTLCASAVGTPPIFYQWRLNGQNIPGATDQCYFIPVAQANNGGNYTCAVGNNLGALGTIPASFLLALPSLPGGDNFVNRVSISGTNGIVASSNMGATREPGEPLHAGKPGGKSIWYKWTSPPAHHGIMTIMTSGSDFDTLLAVYLVKDGMVANVTNLDVVASDEDRGGFFTSRARFNVHDKLDYMIAIDGFSGDAGDFAMSWSLEITNRFLPVIKVQPVSQTLAPGATAHFFVVAVPVGTNGREDSTTDSDYATSKVETPTYQWLFNGTNIVGETNSHLYITNASTNNVGNYSVLVSQVWRTIESQVASLQVNRGLNLQNVLLFDKFQDAYNSTPLLLGTGEPPGGPSINAIIVAGYSGSQVFNTVAGTSQGEIFCGVVGGSSEWLNFAPLQTGVLSLNTDGSSFPVLLAVIQSNVVPVITGCSTNGTLAVQVTAGNNYLIGVDGRNGVSGKVVLNYNLAPAASSPAPQLSNVGTTNGLVKFRITSLTNRFVVQVSTNLTTWSPLTTNNAPQFLYDFIDGRSTNFSRRFYRVQVVP